MAYYAFLDENNIVVEVIAGRDENDLDQGVEDWEVYYSSQRDGLTCKRTSFNTAGGQHKEGGDPFRMNYAGIGYTYDEERDAFVPPKPEEVGPWVLDYSTCLWVHSVPMPEDGKPYEWNEETLSWEIVEQ